MSKNTTLHKHLNDLFLFVPPDQLRQTVTEVFFGYLTYHGTEVPPHHLRTVEDIQFLLQFIEKVKENARG